MGYLSNTELVELEVFASLPFYEKIYELRRLANLSGLLPVEQIEQVVNSLIELSLHLCDLSVKVGVIRVKQPSQNHQRTVLCSETIETKGMETSERKPPERLLPIMFPVLRQQKILLSGKILGQLSFASPEELKVIFAPPAPSVITGGFPGSLFFLVGGELSLFSRHLSSYSLISGTTCMHGELRQYAHGLFGIEIGWKLVYLDCHRLRYLLNQPAQGMLPLPLSMHLPRHQSNKDLSPAQMGIFKLHPHPTSIKKIWVTVTPKNNCLLWSQISAADRGKNLCVYGIVKDAYYGGDQENQIFYMRFSSDTNAFRFIVLEGYYFDKVKDNCVSATGEVKTYGQMPYIEVSEHLYQCNR